MTSSTSHGVAAAEPAPARRLFCNRTLNLRSIAAIGFDMDYTLIHYRVHEWEQRAYGALQKRLQERGWPVSDLTFHPDVFTLGLVLDLELGNVVKANRFGYVKRAAHGTEMLDFETQRNAYSRVLVDLAEPRWVFLNTYFALSEACMYAQLVDRLDEGDIPGVMGYADLHRVIRTSLDEAHMEGALKQQIVSDADRFVERDADLVPALLDLKHAGKKLVVITNSEWSYTQAMLSYALDPDLPKSTTWRQLFDLVIVAARKPAFFTDRNPIFEVTGEEGLLRPFVGKLVDGGIYHGGDAARVEDYLGVTGERILYVGDHLFSDVHVSKSIQRWRTALVLRQLEEEVEALQRFKPQQEKLHRMMADKEAIEREHARLRTHLQRLEHGYGEQPPTDGGLLRERLGELRARLLELDGQLAPLAQAAGELVNDRWGLLMRAGNDKSSLARQVERYADVYTSRVANFGGATPYVYLRSPRGSLPHDSGPAGGLDE